MYFMCCSDVIGRGLCVAIHVADLKNSYWKVFEKGTKMHIMSHAKVCSSTLYHTLFYPNLEDFP